MVATSSLSSEEKARILQALREDAAFRDEMRRLLLEEAQIALQELRESIDRLAAIVHERAEAADRETRRLAEQVRENSRQIAALTERMERVETQIAALTEQVRENSRQIAALTERMERVETQIAALTEQVRENSRQIAALTERMERVETQIVALTEQVRENSRQIASLTEQVRENSRQIASLTEQVRENSRQIAALTERMEQVEAQIIALTEQVRENSRQIAALTGEIRQQRIRLDDVSGAAVEASAREEILIWLRSRGVEISEQYLPGDLQESLNVRSVPDGVLLIRDRSGYIFLVYEVTFTIALRDVRRIAEWLEAFHQTGWPAVGLVYYRRALPEEDDTKETVQGNREVFQTSPGMKTLREEAARAGVLLMQRGTAPWRPPGWRPPQGMAEIPEVLSRNHNSWW
ncbi:MAG: hypothetical protein Q9O62_12225 [Ardenticatenia bacterium]|nr:hypothetical protein [Ardenticatenia bacterium]